MHSFDKYKELRKKYGMTAAHALRSLKHRAVHDWRVALRGWDFDANFINRNTTQMHKEVWSHQMEDGKWVSVEASYDTDHDGLDGLCELSHTLPENYKGQAVVSHESRKKQISRIEDYLQGNVNYVVLGVKIYPPGYGDYDDDTAVVEIESLASAGPLGGVECDDEDYYIETLNELYEEALSDLK